MNEKEFMDLMSKLRDYIDVKKVFTKNPARLKDVADATEMAHLLFGDAMEITIKDDPLQMGALILCIKGFDVVIRGKGEIELFQKLIGKANNFEIYPVGDEKINISILFNNALIRVQ